MFENVLPMFSSMSFMVACLIVRSLNHFKFIFVYGVRECSNFIDLHVAVLLAQHHLKRLSFLHCIFFYIICCGLIGVCVYFWAVYSVALICLFFLPVPCCFDYYSFVVLSAVWESYIPPALFFFLRVALEILGLLWFHIYFRIICSSSG